MNSLEKFQNQSSSLDKSHSDCVIITDDAYIAELNAREASKPFTDDELEGIEKVRAKKENRLDKLPPHPQTQKRGPKPKIVDEKAIIHDHVVNKLTPAKLCRKYKLGDEKIKKVLGEHRIDMRSLRHSRPGSQKIKPATDLQIQIANDYLQPMTVKELTEKHDVSRNAVYNALKKLGIRLRGVQK